MRISVIGTGYVGLVSGACFAEIGHECVCVDVDEKKVDQINNGEAPIHENGLTPMLRRLSGNRLRASIDLHGAVHESEITFIAVGTPFDGEKIDLSYIREVARQVGAALRTKDGYHAVVVKSTVVPGTTDKVVIPLLEEASGKRAGRDFGVGMNPEFLTEGVAVDDFLRPDRIVIGGFDRRSIDVQRNVYKNFPNTLVHVTNNSTAEMIKYVSNSVLATMISFSNEIGNLCSSLGDVDVADVMRGVHSARYFSIATDDGQYSKAPITSFLWAGCGYGGSCLPKDTKALSAHAQVHGRVMPILDAVIKTNIEQPVRMIELLGKHFSSLAGRRLAILGLAFKEDTDDMRESPSIPIVRLLLERGASVVGYDPVAGPNARLVLPSQVEIAESLSAAVEGADAVLLVTRWDEFKRLPEILSVRVNPPVVIDGRRLLDPESVRTYEGIGR